MRWLPIVVFACACGPAEKGEQGEPGVKGDQGPQGPPGPTGSAGTTGQDFAEGVGTGQIVVTGATNYTTIPGLALNFNVPAGAKVHVDTSGGIQCTGTGNAFSAVDIAVFVDGSITNLQRRVVAANTVGLAQIVTNWSFGRTVLLTPGAHSIEVRAAGGDGAMANANVSSAGSPQLQGTLTITTLKQ